jgi:cellulose synthase/poly-beta-1,6-N-acetylglucosamine synthase-like glycosyltransferase
MTVVFIIFFLSYVGFVFLMMRGWQKAITQNSSENFKHLPRCSVVIPVRNESQTIEQLLEDIANQSYGNFEVIIVNDHSTDQTVQVVSSYAENDARVKILHNIGEGKKSALSRGIQESTGELIVTTDGDCRVGEKWLEGMVRSFQKEETQFVFGGVKISGDSFFSSIQSHEFLSLIGCAAASLAFRSPSMCNGANLAFRKFAFIEVGGYAGNLHIPSGDDEFLMRKIFLRYPDGIFFSNRPETVVTTRPAKHLKEFLHQRIRWAGKWRYSQSLSTQLLAIFIFSFHFSSILLLMAALRGWVDALTTIVLLAIKALVEWVFLKRVAGFLEVKWNWAAFMTLQGIYSFYVVATALASNVSSYEWKGRKLKSFTISSVKK